MNTIGLPLVLVLVGVMSAARMGYAQSPATSVGDDLPATATLVAAQELFYNGQYEAASALTVLLCGSTGDDLAACELHTATLLFQIKRELRGPEGKSKDVKTCAVCPELLAAFLAHTTKSQAVARARLDAAPDDEETRFLLGKIDLNYVWLHLGTLGRKTGWKEYWEGRRALDAVLKRNPHHVRARIARAWIDYIVDTKMPRGTRWLLGGGNKSRGVLAVREAAAADADQFTLAEARFALWDMQIRERDLSGAVATAQALSLEYPKNQELAEFLTTHAAGASANR